VAIVALVILAFTVAAGVYLLLTSTRLKDTAPAPAEPVTVPPAPPSADPGAAAKPVRNRDRFDPPSLARAKSEPIPGWRAFAEFIHPALAIIGFGFWVVYTLIRVQAFAVIGLGVLLGAICAGLSWAFTNARAAKRERSATAEGESGTGAPASQASQFPALLFSHRVLLAHAAGAALTLVLAVLVVARV
jgi:hypothetical protein